MLALMIFVVHKNDLTEKQRQAEREKEGGKVSAGLPDACRQVSVHTVL